MNIKTYKKAMNIIQEIDELKSNKEYALSFSNKLTISNKDEISELIEQGFDKAISSYEEEFKNL